MQDPLLDGRARGLGGFLRGLSAALRSVPLTLRNPNMWRAYAVMVLALLAMTIVVGGAMIYAVWRLAGLVPDVSWLGWLASIGAGALRVAGIAIVLLVAPLLALFVLNMVLPIFAEEVFFASMRHFAPERARRLEALRGLPLLTSIGVTIAVFVYFIVLTMVAFAITLVPVVGWAAGPAFQLWITAKTLGWELLDPYFDKCELRFSGQRAYVNRNSMAITGFALPYSFLLAVPIIGPLLFGFAQAATPVLVVDVLDPGDQLP